MLTRLAEWWLIRKARSVDELLYTINRLCYAILRRTASQRQRHLADKIVQDMATTARVLERTNGHSSR